MMTLIPFCIVCRDTKIEKNGIKHGVRNKIQKGLNFNVVNYLAECANAVKPAAIPPFIFFHFEEKLFTTP